MDMDNNKYTHVVTEQGDLGLGANQIKKTNENKEDAKKKESGSKRGYIPGALGGRMGRKN